MGKKPKLHSLLFAPVAAVVLSSCTINGPVMRDYLGSLSSRHPADVLETYSDGRLIFAGIDLDGDRRLDVSVSVGDSGKSILYISVEDIPLDQYFGASLHPLPSVERPWGAKPSPLLERVCEAHRDAPNLGMLKALYSGKQSRTESWLLAVTLRKGGALRETIAKEAFNRLMEGSLTMQSAFILTGFGENGLRLLGKALRETDDRRAARDAAIYLCGAGADAIVALDDLVASLDKSSRGLALLAILDVAKAYPEAVRAHASTIRGYANVWDSEDRRKVRLILEAIEKD